MSYAANVEDIEQRRYGQRAHVQATMEELQAARVTNTPLPVFHSETELLTAPPAAEALTVRHIDLPRIAPHPNPIIFIDGYVSATDAIAVGVPTWTTFPLSGKVATAQTGSKQRLAHIGYDETLEGKPRRIDDDTDGNARWMSSNTLQALPYRVKLLDFGYEAHAINLASDKPRALSPMTLEQWGEQSSTAPAAGAGLVQSPPSFASAPGSLPQSSLHADTLTHARDNATKRTSREASIDEDDLSELSSIDDEQLEAIGSGSIDGLRNFASQPAAHGLLDPSDVDQSAQQDADDHVSRNKGRDYETRTKTAIGASKKRNKKPFIGCPVPGCSPHFPADAKRTRVIKHLIKDHGFPVIRSEQNTGGSKSRIQQLQEDEIRLWLRGQGHPTEHKFFVTPDNTIGGAAQTTQSRNTADDGEEDLEHDDDDALENEVEEDTVDEGANSAVHATSGDPEEEVDEIQEDKARTPRVQESGSLKRKRQPGTPKKRNPSVCCPIPGCTHHLKATARPTHVFDHLQDDHNIPFTRHKRENGGNMDDLRKIQDRQIRGWLRAWGHATDSRFFKWTDGGQPIVYGDEDDRDKAADDVESEDDEEAEDEGVTFGRTAAKGKRRKLNIHIDSPSGQNSNSTSPRTKMSSPAKPNQTGSSSRPSRQSRAIDRTSYQDKIIALNPEHLIPFQVGLKPEVKEWTVTDLLDVGPHLEAIGYEDNIRDIIVGVLAQSATSKKPDGEAPASLLATISSSEYKKKVLEKGDCSDVEGNQAKQKQAKNIQDRVKKGAKQQKRVTFGQGTTAASKLDPLDQVDDDDDDPSDGPTATTPATAPSTTAPPINNTATASTAKSATTARPATRLVCPVPGCVQLAGKNASRRLPILNHLRDDHGIALSKFDGEGGNMNGLQKEQEDAIRAWLRGRGMATDSPFFVTT
ncbi:hypothetical protein LTR85_008186 [Meristemomyces frigidus]|nr:hypothetical protein LTR85_008186 [Meristemomyces frigidus]